MSESGEVVRRLTEISQKLGKVEEKQDKHREEFLVRITQLETSRKANAAVVSTVVSAIVSLAIAFWSWLLHTK